MWNPKIGAYHSISVGFRDKFSIRSQINSPINSQIANANYLSIVTELNNGSRYSDVIALRYV